MNAALQAHISERQRQIEVLRELYRFSPIEAEDFIERFAGDSPVDNQSEVGEHG